MFPYFPRPYPDEIIGSLLTRACRHLGISIKQLSWQALGLRCTYPSYLLGGQLYNISHLSRTPADVLLWQHTVFPYIVAFMPESEVSRLANVVFESNIGGIKTTSCVQSVSKGGTFRRFCPDCASEEIRQYGESYWHRSHLLPAVYVCQKHGTPLRKLGIRISRKSWWTYDLPKDDQGEAETLWLSTEILLELARRSQALLEKNDVYRTDWIILYRQLALRKGYQIPNGGHVATRQLSHDIQAYFGDKLLSDVGSSINLRVADWPALLVRECTIVPFSPVKHLLLKLFLDTCPKGQKQIHLDNPGKKPVNRVILDKRILQLAQKALQEADGVLTVKQLMTLAGCWHQFRHLRTELPLTSEFVHEFRGTERAERRRRRSE